MPNWNDNLPRQNLEGGYEMAHTHPMDDPDRALPSGPDKALAKAGRHGRQHYIISEDRVVAYFSDGSPKDLGDRKAKLGPDVPCNQTIPGDVEEI
jgi:hypothetical protein